VDTADRRAATVRKASRIACSLASKTADQEATTRCCGLSFRLSRARSVRTPRFRLATLLATRESCHRACHQACGAGRCRRRRWPTYRAGDRRKRGRCSRVTAVAWRERDL
jgi:hypothetical protein